MRLTMCALANMDQNGWKLGCLFIIWIAGLKANQDIRPIQLPALGRPFALGDLYNIKEDKIIIGPSLWSHEHLNNFTRELKPETNFKITASETIDEKYNDFNIEAWLKLSFMGGLVSVKGSATYLDHRVTTTNTARVSLKFDQRTFMTRLKPHLYRQVDYPDTIDKFPGPTHVVTAIQYGAAAAFVFDQTVSEYDMKKDVEGSMEIAVKAIPGIQIEGGASVKLSEHEINKANQFQCTFHGDFILKTHPGNYEEAVRVYKELPSLLGANYENSVPMTVYLYPIKALLNKETEILHQARKAMVADVASEIDHLQRTEIRCNDVLESDVSVYHPRLRKNVADFRQNVHVFLMIFRQHLGELLPQLRITGNSSSLAKMLSDKQTSPFSQVNLNRWIGDVNEEVTVLNEIDGLPGMCKHDGDFKAKLLSGPTYTVALTFRLGTEGDEFLSRMKGYLDEKRSLVKRSVPKLRKVHWWNLNKLISDLQQKRQAYATFHKLEEIRLAEGFDSKVQFLTIERELNGTDKRGITLELYQAASLIDPDFDIPSATGKPRRLSISHDSITIQWQQPENGLKNIEFYEVEAFALREKSSQNDSVPGGSNYNKIGSSKEVDKSQNTAKFVGLKPKSIYTFVVGVMTKIGRTSKSESSRDVATGPCPKGMFYEAEKCTPCEPGHYSDKEDATSCQKCTPGSVAKAYGSEKCEYCPKGTFANGQCIPCDPGFFSDSEGASVCRKCPFGKYSDEFRSKNCKDCPESTTTAIEGATGESDCGPNLDQKVKNAMAGVESRMSNAMTGVESRISALEVVSGVIPYGENHILIQNHDFRVESAFQNKRWNDYKSGFGTPHSSEYWIGLDELHRRTQSGRWVLKVEIVWGRTGHLSWADPLAGTSDRVAMDNFKVAGENENYRLSYGSAIRKSREGVEVWFSHSLNQMAFSTEDRDNDKAGYNCAQNQKGGWWFRNCAYICLNCHKFIVQDRGQYRYPASSSMTMRKIS